MRLALLSDVHGNVAALEAVLDDIRQQGMVDACWFLGDVVGYYPRPVACINHLLPLVEPHAWLMGNHDRAVWEIMPLGELSARENLAHRLIPKSHDLMIIEWHGCQLDVGLTVEQKSMLRQAPTWRRIRPHICLAHGVILSSPDDIENISGPKSYLDNPAAAQDCFDKLPGLLAAQGVNDESVDLLITGHTHVPMFWQAKRRGPNMWSVLMPIEHDVTYRLIDINEQPVIINPGSVGQPRDGDNRAAYAVLDLESMTIIYRRVSYNIYETLAEMQPHYADLFYNERIRNRLLYGK